MTGRCTCGAVVFAATAEPVWVAYCHCRDCRRATGAPVALWVGFPSAAVTMSGPAAWRVGRTAAVARGFCSSCGSPLAYRDSTIEDDEIYLAIGTFDAPNAVVPQAHAWFGERLGYVVISDGLPKLPTFSRSRKHDAATEESIGQPPKTSLPGSAS